MDTEVLDTNEVIVPDYLQEYLENDEQAINKIDEKISDLKSKQDKLEEEKLAKERDLNRRLE